MLQLHEQKALINSAQTQPAVLVTMCSSGSSAMSTMFGRCAVACYVQSGLRLLKCKADFDMVHIAGRQDHNPRKGSRRHSRALLA